MRLDEHNRVNESPRVKQITLCPFDFAEHEPYIVGELLTSPGYLDTIRTAVQSRRVPPRQPRLSPTLDGRRHWYPSFPSGRWQEPYLHARRTTTLKSIAHRASRNHGARTHRF